MYLPPRALAKITFLEHPLHPPIDLDEWGRTLTPSPDLGFENF